MAQEAPPDIVVLTGRELPRLLGVPPTEISAVAAHSGTLAPVHLQIDQRYRDDRGNWHYAFEGGEEPQPAQTVGLGADDLLLVVASEGGDRVQPAPPDRTEIEVTNRPGTTSRWFYVGRGVAPLLEPLVRYDATQDRTAGVDYAIGFSHRRTAVIDSLVLGDPEHGTNILDRNKARLDVDLALGIGSVHRTEDDVRVRTTGLHVGPLRIIRESEIRGRMLLGVYSAPVRDDFIFYPHGFVLPTTIRLTPSVRMFVRNVTLRISMDLTDAAGALTFQSGPEVPTPIAIDGRAGLRGGRQAIGWYLLRRGEIGLLGWLQARDDIAHDVALYYRDDRSHADPPERLTGEFGDHGFIFHHAGPLPSGDVHLGSYASILHGDALDRPADELRAFASRPTVRVH